ncbi:AbrB/MazE/SpoVT family DNA-binding domain-containing protein [Neiella marina]|uniref:AbrB/MazE/SpoVT family DNA-binding domain-containing protein n=1 Tax=Neiella holothuriorum TaxID=2870530 RepID=A0ABS7EHS3_9GAMM|nr:AbrB/MazE/SpoVT family DNA-binding domain-containing protein [Neiella holothuriorum]MBW8191306.1 AbrB/MazE/SpoVT family DNA-binding domain-containing protein [Neiella holothuriorum]
MRTQVRRIGNSLGSIIPAAFARQLELSEGAEIDVQVQAGKLVIAPAPKPKKRFPFSEAELVSGLDAFTAHADELATVSGKELGE